MSEFIEYEGSLDDLKEVINPTPTPERDRGDELRETCEKYLQHGPDEHGQELVCDLLAQLDAQRAVIERLERYEDGGEVWFIDDDHNTRRGCVEAWNETYALIDTPEDRFTVEHEHVFINHPTVEEVQTALAASGGSDE